VLRWKIFSVHTWAENVVELTAKDPNGFNESR
jgi:hypothetical protein